MTNDFEFMTYQEAAKRLNIAQASVKRQATRNKCSCLRGRIGRRTGNEGNGHARP